MTSNTYAESYDGKTKNPNVKVFSASWDRRMWILNSVLIILLGVITITLLIAGLYGMRENMFCAIIVFAASPVPVLILLVGAAFAPRQYQTTGDSILVNRLLAKDVKIPLSGVYSIEPVNYKYVFKKSVRIFGSGGSFGIYGDFTSPNLKYFKAYMTRRDRLVLIRTTDKPFLLTPDDPEGFIATVKDGQSRTEQLRST
ncbi:MAG: hypothetical protein JW804_01925 [Sedimentisphaerales bacterium]|nr:hypothetical protein [Sedimentisphaerales bacterium]